MKSVIVDGWNVFGYNGPITDGSKVLIASKYMDEDYEIFICFDNDVNERFVLYQGNKLIKTSSRCSNLMAFVDKKIDSFLIGDALIT